MSRLVTAELLKLRTTGMLLRFVLAALIVPATVALVSALQSDFPERAVPSRGADYEVMSPSERRSVTRTRRDQARTVMAAWSITALVASVLGLVVGAGEAQRGTLVASVLAEPRRWRLALGQLAFAALAALVLGGLGFLAGMAAAKYGLARRDVAVPVEGARWLGLAGGGLLACVLAAIAGHGLGLLMRNVGLAVGVLAVAVFIVEPALARESEALARFAPQHLLDALLGGWNSVGGAGRELLSPAAAAAVGAAGAAGIAGAGVQALESRELP